MWHPTADDDCLDFNNWAEGGTIGQPNGWGVGGVLVGSLSNTPPAESPVYKGLPRVLGGVWGCLEPYDDKS